MDTSKSVFQLHGVDENEEPVLRRRLRRHQVLAFFAKLEPTMIGMEACGASYYWARALKALGHEVVLIPPQYVKAYVDRGKNDAADAEAICEAMSRPKIKKRFVPIKSPDQQAAQMLIGAREALLRRRTQVSNAIRGYAAEFGVAVPKGLAQIEPLLERLGQDQAIPQLAKEMFVMLAGQYRHVNAQLTEIEAKMKAFYRGNELCKRLAEVPVIGLVTATAMVAKVTAPKMFGSGRNFSAWIGLTPKDHSTAGRLKLGVITRAGDVMLRSLLVCGATAVIRQVKLQIKAGKTANVSPWLLDLVRRKPAKLAAVALANKAARIAWKLMVSGERYDARKATALQQCLSASNAGDLEDAA
jgi:transposase